MTDKATQDNRLLVITTPLGKDYLLLNRLTATEEISALFSFEVELMYDHGKIRGYEPQPIDPKLILGQAVSIDIRQPEGITRTFSGIVNHFSQGHRDIRFSYYHATIVPNIWILTQVSQSRTFQHTSVPDILKKVFTGFDVSYELQGNYKPRNYCVQYRETDFDFASRLMEEEGIFYFFEHAGGKNKLIVADTPQSHPPCPSKSEIPYFLDVGSDQDYITSIIKWQDNHRLQSGKVTYWDFNFQVPFNKLDATQPTLYKVAGNDQMEIYDFPSGPARKYDDIDRGGGERADVQNVFDDKQKRAEIAMQSLDTQYRTITGTSDCCALTAGYRFTFFNHPQEEQNGQYVVTSVTHEVEQNPTYKTSDKIENPYINSFSCIAYGKGSPPFRPVRKTPKPIVRGSQTAFVVGPAGEEIFTDKFGRVKVQFHWDRHGKIDSDSSCWIRVAQAWAGNRWGMMFIPRIGMEVVVEFLEGDPDQPIITGCVYNPETMPPYTLPAEKTKMTIKSNSSKGGGGFNEIRFEDKKGKEQIFIHAEKDEDIRVENNATETIIANRHLSVGGSQYESVGKDKHLKVGGDQNEEVGGSVSLTVGKDTQIKTGKRYALDAKNEIHLKSGSTLLVESKNKLTLKVGGNHISITAMAIYIKGKMVKINSGSAPLSALAACPAKPTAPRKVDKTGAGIATGKKPAPPPLNLALVMAFALAHAAIAQKRSRAAQRRALVQAMIIAMVTAQQLGAPFVRLFDSSSAKKKPAS